MKKAEIKVNQQPVHNDQPKYKFELGGMLVYDLKAAIQVGHCSNKIQLLNTNQKNSRSAKSKLENFSEDMNENEIELLLKSKKFKEMPDFTPEYILEIPKDNATLIFDSKFESGNLSKAIKLSDYEYKLFINSDTGTSRHNHWYYFSVKNSRPCSIIFRIENMMKHDPLYKKGMQPLV